MPVPPKDPTTRARRNKTSTNAILRLVDPGAIPAMPPGNWRPESVAWWKTVWSSPMRQEFADADHQVLIRMLLLNESIFAAFEDGNMNLFVKLQGEMRQQEMRFGLTPLDRRRLQWTIEQGEAAEEKTTQRRAQKAATRGKPKAVPDPRELLA